MSKLYTLTDTRYPTRPQVVVGKITVFTSLEEVKKAMLKGERVVQVLVTIIEKT